VAYEEKENSGVLFPNDRKEKGTHPDYRGHGNYDGVEFDIAGWKKLSKDGKPRLSLSFKEAYKKPQPAQSDDFEF